MNAFHVFETLRLYLPRRYYPFSNLCARLAWRCLADIFERNRSYLALYVDAVEKRTAYLVHVFLYLPGRAYAVMGGVAIVAARAGVHGGYELEVAGVADAVFRPAYGDAPVLKGLAEHFQGVLVELGQLVGEEYSVVCEADFARHGIGASAYQRHLGDGVVWPAERPA